MKKKLLFILLLLVPFLVNAKENISYSWDKQNNNGMEFITEEDNQYIVAENHYGNNTTRYQFSYYAPDGQKVKSEKWSDMEADEVDAIWNKSNYYYRAEFETDDQYGWVNPGNNEIFFCDKGTGVCNSYSLDDYTEEEIKEYAGDYYFFVEYYREHDQFFDCGILNGFYVIYTWDNRDNNTIEIYDKNGNKVLQKKYDKSIWCVDITVYGIYIITTDYDHITKKAVYNLQKYDLNGKEEYQKDLTEIITAESEFTTEDLYYLQIDNIRIVNNGIIVNLGDNIDTYQTQMCIEDYMEHGPVNTNLPGYKGDSSGEPIVPDDYEPTIEDALEYCSWGWNVVVKKTDSLTVMGKKEEVEKIMIQKSEAEKSTLGESLDPTGGRRDANRAPSNFGFRLYPYILIKLNLDYAVETKVEGQGEIKVISRSASGGEVTFEITPKPGYVLSEVKVTDALGNIITFTDYKFTMPSSDVLIEVKFVPENPNTVDILFLVLPFVIIGGIAAAMMYKKVSWLR